MSRFGGSYIGPRELLFQQKGLVVDGKITSYDVVIEITFVLDD